MSDFIDSFNHPETATAAAVGCATGFLWSTLAGQADLGTGRGFLQATYGCLGSAINGAGVYGISRYATRDADAARQITTLWFGAQSAASFTNFLGLKNAWQGDAAFNAVALPLNFAATPATSSLGLVLAGLGEAGTGFQGKVGVFGGSLYFHHNLCGISKKEAGAFQTGIIGHYCNPYPELQSKFHENGHLVQFSILGDVGGMALFLLNGNFLEPWVPGIRRHLVTEGWADDYRDRALYYYSRSEGFHLKRLQRMEEYARLQELELRQALDPSDLSSLRSYPQRLAHYLKEYFSALSLLTSSQDPKEEERIKATLGNLGREAGLSEERIQNDLDLVAALRTFERINGNPARLRLTAAQKYFELFGKFLEKVAESPTSLGAVDSYFDGLRKSGPEAGMSATRVESDVRRLANLGYRCTLAKAKGIFLEISAAESGESKLDPNYFLKGFPDFLEALQWYGAKIGLGKARIQSDYQKLLASAYQASRNRALDLAGKSDTQPFLKMLEGFGKDVGLMPEKIAEDRAAIAEKAYRVAREIQYEQLGYTEEPFAYDQILFELKNYAGAARIPQAEFEKEKKEFALAAYRAYLRVFRQVIREGKGFGYDLAMLWQIGSDAGIARERIEQDILNRKWLRNFLNSPQTATEKGISLAVRAEAQYLKAYLAAVRQIEDDQGFEEALLEMWKFGTAGGLENQEIHRDVWKLVTRAYEKLKDQARALLKDKKNPEEKFEAIRVMGKKAGMPPEKVEEDIQVLKVLGSSNNRGFPPPKP